MFDRSAKRLFAIAGAAAVLIAGGSAFAADANVTGKWSGEVALPNGNKAPLVAELKQEGMALTGMLEGINGAPNVPIENGMVHGDTIMFSSTRTGPQGAMKFSYTGKVVAPNAIDFDIVRTDVQAAPMKTRATKVN